MAGFAASRILDVLLGEYIEEDKGARQIELDLLKGHLLLRNIAVRSGALQRALGLPLVIKHGVIARIELRIPWGKLGSEPTRLTLDGLQVYVTPQSEAEWDAYAEEEREFLRKQATLNKINPTAEALGGQAAEPGEQKQSFISKLTSQVLERLQAIARLPHSSAGRPCGATLPSAFTLRSSQAPDVLLDGCSASPSELALSFPLRLLSLAPRNFSLPTSLSLILTHAPLL